MPNFILSGMQLKFEIISMIMVALWYKIAQDKNFTIVSPGLTWFTLKFHATQSNHIFSLLNLLTGWKCSARHYAEYLCLKKNVSDTTEKL